jgi:hypothetical protein
MPSAPGFVVNGFKREQLVAMNSMILHNVFFDGPGEESEPGSVLAQLQKLMDESVPPLRRLLGGRPDRQLDACHGAWRSAARGRECEPGR